jgi:hypothetical protein
MIYNLLRPFISQTLNNLTEDESVKLIGYMKMIVQEAESV